MILFKFSVEHDCRIARCLPSALRPQMQERHETSQTISLIAHQDDAHYIINLHALHNAALVRKYLPRHLTQPKPLYEDRQARHNELARNLRITQTEKRAKSAAKAKATREANKAKKQSRTAVAAVSERPDVEAETEDEDGMEDEPGGQLGQRKRRRNA
jgi:hypothetical protein